MRILIASVLALLTACSSLPSQMPPDFSLEVNESGGMLPYSSRMMVSLNECRYGKSYLYSGQELKSDFHFTLDREELQSLYQTLADRRFDAVTTHHEEIYDRGGFQVTVTANKKTYIVVDGGQSVVDLLWQPSWKAIYDRIASLEETALERAGSRVTVRLSPELRRQPALYVSLDLKSVLSNPEPLPEVAETVVFPGTYVLQVHDGTGKGLNQVVTIDGPRTFDLTWNSAVSVR